MLSAFDLSHPLKLYTQKIVARKDSQTGEYLIPPHATDKPMLSVVDGKKQGFVTGEWKYYSDNCGVKYWLDGVEHVINEVGEEVPDGALFEKPAVQITRHEQIEKANNECTVRINSRWNPVGQINAALGVYAEEERSACADWISQHRLTLSVITSRDDLLEIDVSSNEYWPTPN